MNRISILGAAALLAVLPTAVHAQSTPATTSSSQEIIVEKNTTVVVKEAPKPSPVTFTPYGFLLLNAYFNDAPFAQKQYPGSPLPCPKAGAADGCNVGGAFLLNVRQTRLGSRLAFDDTAGWTGATLSALVEVDFNGGFFATNPSGYYNSILRLRKAYTDAAWGTESKFTLRIGQDDRLVSPLRPVSLAYIADPLFQQAGLLHGRAPLLEARWDLNPKNGLGVSVAAAALTPMETTVAVVGTVKGAPVTAAAPNQNVVINPSPDIPGWNVSPGGAGIDFGSGNRARLPNLEGRIGVSWKSDGKKIVDLGGWGGWQKNRFYVPVDPAFLTSAGKTLDVDSTIVGGDLTVNLWFFQALASIYTARGYEVPGAFASQGVAFKTGNTAFVPAVAGGAAAHSGSGLAGTAATGVTATAVKANGGWFQISARPIEALQVYGGWGGVDSPFNQILGTTAAQGGAGRINNYMWAVGVVGYAGKNWRFSAEYASDKATYATDATATGAQFSLNSQLIF